MNKLRSLQQAADWQSQERARKRLVGAGIGCIVFGTLAVLMGIHGMEGQPLNGILALIGLLLLLEGGWLVTAPRLVAMLVYGLTLFVLGIWNILVTCVNIRQGAYAWAPHVVILGILQIGWGFEELMRYRRFSGVMPQEPPPEALEQLNDLVTSLLAEDPRQAPDVIKFREKRFPKERWWKGRLTEDMGLFILSDGQDVLVAGKDQVTFKKHGKLPLESTLAAAFFIGARRMSGYISPESFQKYEAWTSTITSHEQESLFRRIPFIVWAFIVCVALAGIILLWVFMSFE